jgi:hypothetical protein
VAELIRAAGPPLLGRAQMCLSRQHWKALNAILRRRTAALFGHIDACSRCGYRALSTTYRNRHCPKCQANARHRWLQARRAELLPTRYVPSFHPTVRVSTAGVGEQKSPLPTDVGDKRGNLPGVRPQT